MKTSIISVLCLITGIAFAKTESKEFDSNGLEDLKFKNSVGNVSFTLSTDDKVYVTAKKEIFEKNCILIMRRSDNELRIKAKKEGFFNSDKCKVHFDIKVPKKIALFIKMGSGNIKVKDTDGKIKFNLGSGKVDIDARVSKLEGKSGSGSIDIMGLTGSADLKSGSGNLNITYNTIVKSGELNIKSGSGNANIFLPAAMKVKTNYMSGSGRMINELGDTAGSSFEVSMKVGSGNLNIKKLK